MTILKDPAPTWSLRRAEVVRKPLVQLGLGTVALVAARNGEGAVQQLELDHIMEGAVQKSGLNKGFDLLPRIVRTEQESDR